LMTMLISGWSPCDWGLRLSDACGAETHLLTHVGAPTHAADTSSTETASSSRKAERDDPHAICAN
jgi:hypothetical protein